MAVRSFNFLPHRAWSLAQRRRRLGRWSLVSAGLALLAVWGVQAGLTQALRQQAQVHAAWQRGLHQLAQRTADLANAQPTLTAVQAHAAAIEHLQVDRNASVHLFNRLLPLLPPGLALSQLSLSGLQTEIQGQAQQQIQVAQLFHALHASPAFSQVEWLDLARQGVVASPATSGTDLGFSLRARLRLASPPDLNP